jgi:hypothetical protein
MKSVNTLMRPVTDIVMNDGYQCKFNGCIYTVKDKETAWRHVQEHEVDPDSYLLKVKVQQVFNSYLHKYCAVEAENVEIDIETETGRMLAAFRQQAKELLPKASPIGILLLYTCLILVSAQQDLRLSNAFIAWSRWDLLVDGIEWKTLRDMAVILMIKDHLHHIMVECREYIKEICKDLNKGSAIIRREIMDNE